MYRSTMNLRGTLLRHLIAAGLVAGAGFGVASGQQTKIGAGHAPLSRFAVGLHVGGVLTTSSADFDSFPGVESCIGAQSPSRYSAGSGGGFEVAAMLALNPAMGSGFVSHLGGDLRIGFSSSSTGFGADEGIGQTANAAGEPVPVVAHYALTGRLSELSIEPAVAYRLSSEAPLHLRLGLRMGYLLGGTYDYEEQIASPGGATFGDGSTTRNPQSGDMTGLRKLQMGLTAGIGYEIGLGGSLALRPELSALVGFQSPVNGLTWKPSEIRLGLSVLYTLPHEESSPLE
ncbi:MAG TPA: outer membrane beta-barrel protein [Candidatus Kapabacteria bacterium]|nr:outer membrane beta-barrel protein [Candidatus Kapabacteria bacterium]